MNKYALAVIALLSVSTAPISIAQHQTANIMPVHSVEHVVSLDVKYVGDTVHLLLGKKINGASSLWYQTSSDQGQTWANEVEVTHNQSSEANARRGNDARLAVQGKHIAAVWTASNEASHHNAGPMVAMASEDSGKTWHDITSPADWLEGSHAFFAMDATDDEMALVWLDSRTKTGTGATQGLRYSKSIDGGMTWSANQTLDERSCACCWNTAQYNGDEFYVLYRDKDPTDMTLGKVDTEQQWQAMSTVGAFNWDFQGCPHIGGSIAFDNDHDIIHSTIGTGHPDKIGTYYLNSKDGGKTWTEPFSLGGETAVHSDLAASDNGHVLAVWDMITESGFQIMAAQSNDLGESWSADMKLSLQGLRATHPRTVALKKGFLVFWTEGEAKTSSTLRVSKVD